MSLRVENLSFGYYGGHPVLRGLNLDIHAGRVTGIFGPNGSGKSTLLQCLNGALRPQTGCVLHEDQRLDALSPRDIAARIAVVPQETPAHSPFLVHEMVMMGRFARWNLWDQESSADHRAVHASLERVVALDLANRHFDELSGGERQRVIIARALAQETRVLLLDEPASHLDIAHQLEVFRLAHQLAREGYLILMVCHDLILAPMFTDEVVLLKDGQVFANGRPEEVLRSANLHQVFETDIALTWSGGSSVTLALAAGADESSSGGSGGVAP